MNHSKKELIEQFFSYLSYIGHSENKIDAISLQKYMTADCIIQSNHEVVSRGVPEIIQYSHQMQEKYKKVSYSDLLETPLISGEKATIHFQVKCVTKADSEEFLDVIAILTFENGKISAWEEVFQNIIISDL